MAKENQRITLTKRLLKEAILRLLKEKSIDKINVSELCQEAGINRATFYRHYETPHDVLVEMEMDCYNEIYNSTGFPQNVQDSEKYILQLCTYLYEHADLVKIFIRSNTDQEFTQLLWKFYHDILVQKNFPMDADSLRLTAIYFAGGGYFLMREWLMADIQKSPKEIAALVSGFINKAFVFPNIT